MPDNFTRLPPEEQERILAACIAEFAEHGYRQASTNAIVKRAGIPKGTLFFYFGSKKELYLYVIDQAVARYTALFEKDAADPPADLFERLLYFGRSRMRFAISQPHLYRLFFNAFVNAPDEIRALLQSRFTDYASVSRQMLFEDLDLSPFRADAPVEQVVDLVFLVLEGIYNRYLTRWQGLGPEQSLEWVEQMTAEVRAYFELIKKGVYRG